jgi:hypothetical protein
MDANTANDSTGISVSCMLPTGLRAWEIEFSKEHEKSD